MFTLLGAKTGGLAAGLAGFTGPELVKALAFISARMEGREYIMEIG